MIDHVLYLHGFASSARSTKAGYFAERLAPFGLTLRCPDFNEPDFATLTMTRMLEQVGRELDALGAGTVAVIGSSLGGSVAILAASRYGARIDRLVLMAPAVLFAKPGHHLLPPERLREWRRLGSLPFFHFAYGEKRPLEYAFYEDSLRYNPLDAPFAQPTRLFQGSRDESVSPEGAQAFAATRPNVTLTMLDDDHQLIASLPTIWGGVSAFLELA